MGQIKNIKLHIVTDIKEFRFLHQTKCRTKTTFHAAATSHAFQTSDHASKWLPDRVSTLCVYPLYTPVTNENPTPLNARGPSHGPICYYLVRIGAASSLENFHHVSKWTRSVIVYAPTHRPR